MAFTRTTPAHIQVWYGHTKVTSESLSSSGGGVWIFAHAPVSTQKLIVTGTKSGVTRILANYTLEPLQGALTIPASFPSFDSVHATYYWYTGFIKVLTKDFSVPFPEHSSQPDITGKPIYTLNNNYPTKVTMSVALSEEKNRALLTEYMRHGYFVLIVDRYIPQDSAYDMQAWEGPLVSSDQTALYKGKPYLMGITLEVSENGLYDPVTDTVNWETFNN
jgi:hypothetical protein